MCSQHSARGAHPLQIAGMALTLRFTAIIAATSVIGVAVRRAVARIVRAEPAPPPRSHLTMVRDVWGRNLNLMEVESWASTPAVRRSMQSNHSRDTRPELALRKILWAEGLRYRVAARPVQDVKRKVDIAFGPSRVAVEIHGCFWHGCPTHYRAPTRNHGYWHAKIERNIARDQAAALALAEAGWLLVVVWEHDDLGNAAREIVQLVTERHPTRMGRNQ